ncbi:hypothetical protein CONLIGDRAFT_127063 [Coniochaeta ligniaria NRRL 30616]|uniref:Uncharacterized protein n=1 Tax=Coniochaeta ligniaria NRRL 30616 TaxID=1408157 RepID=A0A1J7I722_9PEZI|nr:hypothetical protein CONLIGDRAFT_127063 [Coniochaeta ligniaria NRRL 30616]
MQVLCNCFIYLFSWRVQFCTSICLVAAHLWEEFDPNLLILRVSAGRLDLSELSMSSHSRTDAIGRCQAICRLDLSRRSREDCSRKHHRRKGQIDSKSRTATVAPAVSAAKLATDHFSPTAVAWLGPDIKNDNVQLPVTLQPSRLHSKDGSSHGGPACAWGAHPNLPPANPLSPCRALAVWCASRVCLTLQCWVAVG